MINYYLITKPGIILGNLLTVAAGFLLASKGQIEVGLFLATLLGLSLIIASACVFNNYIDRSYDKAMERTKSRALVLGLIPEKNALLFGTALGILGGACLLIFTNILTFAVAAVGFGVYVFLYSLWKSKTIYGTAIGSVAGAVPPVVGYCAVSNTLDMGAGILFLMMILWQMPHFFSIAILYRDDYAAAGMPVLPVVKGNFRTKVHMVVYIVAFMLVSLLLTVWHYTGGLYFALSLGLSVVWLGLAVFGFYTTNDKAWGRAMFRFSLVLITALCVAIPFDVV